MLRPLASLIQSPVVGRCEGFVVDRGIGNRARNRIKQALKHPNRRRQLARRQSLDQFVGMLFVCRHNIAILHRDSAADTY